MRLRPAAASAPRRRPAPGIARGGNAFGHRVFKPGQAQSRVSSSARARRRSAPDAPPSCRAEPPLPKTKRALGTSRLPRDLPRGAVRVLTIHCAGRLFPGFPSPWTGALGAARMAAPGAFNPNLPSVKRILQETRELELEPSDQFRAAPLEDNLFEWHFTVRGPDGTPFEGGRCARGAQRTLQRARPRAWLSPSCSQPWQRRTPLLRGRYHGRLLMPADYPFKPPTIMMLTPNGRFEVRRPTRDVLWRAHARASPCRVRRGAHVARMRARARRRCASASASPSPTSIRSNGSRRGACARS